MGKLPAELVASDHSTMILLTGAKVSISLDDPVALEKEQIKKTMSVKSIYMDRNKVTNYLYVRFLNKIDGITVKEKSVFWNGSLLLLLGEVKEGYEPIIFKEGIFEVKPDAVANPVVRVTPIGALAYANFYGRSVPSMEQWWLAVQTGHDQISHNKTSSSTQAERNMWSGNWMMQNQRFESEPSNTPQKPGIQPVTQMTVNSVGIQGLEQNVNEWTVTLAPDGTPKFHVHGGIGEQDHRESYLEREPWEAFSDVGFRTVLNPEGEK
jgi:serine/threonine-protein kinase